MKNSFVACLLFLALASTCIPSVELPDLSECIDECRLVWNDCRNRCSTANCPRTCADVDCSPGGECDEYQSDILCIGDKYSACAETCYDRRADCTDDLIACTSWCIDQVETELQEALK